MIYFFVNCLFIKFDRFKEKIHTVDETEAVASQRVEQHTHFTEQHYLNVSVDQRHLAGLSYNKIDVLRRINQTTNEEKNVRRTAVCHPITKQRIPQMPSAKQVKSKEAEFTTRITISSNKIPKFVDVVNMALVCEVKRNRVKENYAEGATLAIVIWIDDFSYSSGVRMVRFKFIDRSKRVFYKQASKSYLWFIWPKHKYEVTKIDRIASLEELKTYFWGTKNISFVLKFFSMDNLAAWSESYFTNGYFRCPCCNALIHDLIRFDVADTNYALIKTKLDSSDRSRDRGILKNEAKKNQTGYWDIPWYWNYSTNIMLTTPTMHNVKDVGTIAITILLRERKHVEHGTMSTWKAKMRDSIFKHSAKQLSENLDIPSFSAFEIRRLVNATEDLLADHNGADAFLKSLFERLRYMIWMYYTPNEVIMENPYLARLAVSNFIIFLIEEYKLPGSCHSMYHHRNLLHVIKEALEHRIPFIHLSEEDGERWIKFANYFFSTMTSHQADEYAKYVQHEYLVLFGQSKYANASDSSLKSKHSKMKYPVFDFKILIGPCFYSARQFILDYLKFLPAEILEEIQCFVDTKNKALLLDFISKGEAEDLANYTETLCTCGKCSQNINTWQKFSIEEMSQVLQFSTSIPTATVKRIKKKSKKLSSQFNEEEDEETIDVEEENPTEDDYELMAVAETVQPPYKRSRTINSNFEGYELDMTQLVEADEESLFLESSDDEYEE